jgi:two-component system, NtrC family, sensor histidine kinase GlrK
MKLTIFSRLTLGYLVMFLLIGSVTGYALLRLHLLNKVTARIINVDQRVLDLGKKLEDTVLSQMGYEKKFIITKDVTFYQRFLSAEGDFNRYLAEAMMLTESVAKTESLTRLHTYYEQYRTLVVSEAERASNDRSYPMNWYAQEKEHMVEAILEELKVLAETSERDIRTRMNELTEAASSSPRYTIYMFIAVLILVVATSFLTTRSITNPLTILMEKTKEVSRGIFKGDLNLTSPPEIEELSGAFNLMCDKLRRVEKMKSEFFSTMSHELRTPLASIKEGIGLLQDEAAGGNTYKQKRLLSILSEETHRLIGLVNSLLDLSKMEEGMMTYQFQREELGLLAKQVVAEMSPLMEAKKIRLRLEIHPKLPLLKLDRERMLQALRNLVGNAVKFTPEGGLVGITAHVGSERVELAVHNAGPVIPKENLAVIFEKFQQLPVKTSEWTKGTGLGLAIVKHIVTAHGGVVWAESEPGKGNVFYVTLPL